MKNEILLHKNQSEIADFLKTENANCLSCMDCLDKVCDSMTSDYYGVSILDISDSFCIHKAAERNDDDYENLFDESL